MNEKDKDKKDKITYKEIELKLYRLRQMGFNLNDKIYRKAVKQRALLEYPRKR